MRAFSFIHRLVITVCFCLLSHSLVAVEGFYSWPTVAEGSLVFTAEGDLWRLDDGAAQATRLTTHAEVESQAVLSPDGENIAFVASFDGISQVYVMAATGGIPRQLTFESVSTQVRGWTPDGRILYTSRNMEGSSRVRELRMVNPEDASIERLPLRYATTGTFDDSMESLYFTRHGIDTVGDSALMYRGGGMSQLWKFDYGDSDEAERLAENFEGPIENPMLWDDRIYFVSDESGFENIWSMNLNGNSLRQHSDFEGWRVKQPKMHDGAIYYQRGADIYAFDLSDNSNNMIEIDLASDRDRSRLRWLETPLEYITSSHMGSIGERVAVSARGNVTVAGTEKIRRTDLPIPEGARARNAVPGGNGEWIYAIVDADDRGEIWRFASNGSGQGEQLTDNADDHRWRFVISPDGQWLIHSDKAARLWKLNLDSLENTLITQTNSGNDDDFSGFSFSPDGKHLAYTTTGRRVMGSVIYVHELSAQEVTQITNDKYNSYSPAFSADGQWLYYLSDRQFRATPSAPWGDRNMGAEFDKRTLVFALALTEDSTFPYAPANELTVTEEDDEDSDSGEEASENSEEESTTPLEINWADAQERFYQVPVAAGNFSSLQASADHLYLLDSSGSGRALKRLPISDSDPELEVFAPRVSRYELSADTSKAFLVIPGEPVSMAIVPTDKKVPEDLSAFTVNTAGWRLAINPAEEWEQMFLDAWRLHRDFSYDSSMRGVDWEGVRDRLLPLTARIGHRTDLSDLLAQMSFELGILHSQIRQGDVPDDDESGTLASLGARYATHENGLEIVQVYQGDKDRPATLGPLAGAQTDIAVGDVITAVNYQPIVTHGDLEQALMYQTGKQVVVQTTRGNESKTHVVNPVSTGAESMLRYLDWTGANYEKVNEATDGEIGYLHIRAMGGNDMSSFARDFFGQNHLDGLIVDVRDNNGGNIDSWIINQFLRRAWAFWKFEAGGPSYSNMQEAFRGHFVVLINAGTYSDGESFAAGIKALDLAPLIGERTAGAGIWLSARNILSDGGQARIAETPQYGLDGRWLIEGYGIAPDIEVIAEPKALFNGVDQQLNAAIEYLQEKIEDEPIPELRSLPLPELGEPGRDVRD